MSHPSDNLYSANDEEDDNIFDRQSISDELSPSDGYFNRGGGMPSNTMVADPSLDRKERVEDKTLIPTPNIQQRAGQSSRSSMHPLLSRTPPSQSYASQQASSQSPPTPTSYTPASPVSPHRNEEMFSENSALLNGPPPAYTPSPVSPTTASEPVERSYSTFPEHHLESGIPPLREPESMGAPAYEPTENTPLASIKKLTPTKKRWLKHFGFAVLALVLFTMFTTATFRHDKDADKLPPPGNGGSEPSKGQPDNDDGHERPIDSSTPYCTAAKYKEDVVTYEFPVGSDLTVLQTTESGGSLYERSVSTVGEIRLRRLPKNSIHGNRAYFTVDVQVSDESLQVDKTWDEDSRVLKIVTPSTAPLRPGLNHCISLEITAWIPEDAQFSSLLIEAISLTLRVVDDIKVNVSGRSKFTTISGGVRFPAIDATDAKSQADSPGWRSSDGFPFSSRKIFVETMSGSIRGNYPLMDVLGLSSQSGSIHADVFPQPVLPSAPAPADLEVQSSSGTIKVNCPVGGDSDPSYTPPPRNYITTVHSTSSSISGSYYIGSSNSFKTTSGTIKITGLPVLRAGDSHTAPNNSFETHTISGTTDVELLDPIFISLLSNQLENQKPVGDDEPFLIIPPNNIGTQALFEIDSRTSADDTKLHTLSSIHSSNSATIKLKYPSAWEGTVHGKSVSGNIVARGEGVRIIKFRNGPGFSELVARKGVEDKGQGSMVEMKGISGSLNFLVGK
ncbi:hypothetical protein ONS95_014040 [Cadophora gregata]|uniref:uncharacterized protein n=1 Tax=Cadophora gregata TaxID=51156 RepID=UPI0026DA73B6|nr:uncharacterized protein ONS95_014040 [Cadophora gregata]KAK0113790.1 hypothetical protein ONS96_014645 [Cadophora gregata f. sp. sojae]KAK0114550.1 hypothetical protein ONS95_014040 [Cadophora gregata]